MQRTSTLAGQAAEVKFVCKDIWQALFGKQADRLQMNRRFQLDVGLVDSASGS